MANSLDKKRVLTMVGLGTAAVLVTGVIMFSATQQGGGGGNQRDDVADEEVGNVGSGVFSQASKPDDAQDETDEHTAAPNEDFVDIAVMSAERLEVLRERANEITELYDGAPEGQYLGELEDSDDLHANVGQLSNFDERATGQATYSLSGDDEESSVRDGELESVADDTETIEPGAVEESTIGGVLGDAPVQPEGELPNDDLTDAELNYLLETTSASPMAPAEELNDLIMRLEDIDANVSELAQTMAYLESRPQTSATDQRSIQAIESSVTATQVEVRALRERLDTLDEVNLFSADEVERLVEERLSAELENSLEQMAAEIEERLNAQLSSQSQPATPAPSRAPSRPNVSTLYEMLSIEGNAVVLRGLNTGRTFRLSEGDSLAYGGTLERIQGDRAILRWPHQTITLHVFN